MEAQTISFPPAPFCSPPSPILVSIYRGARAPSLSLPRSFPPPPPAPLPSSLPVSSVLPVAVSFWLTSSLASFLPFSVGSLEKLCALRGEHPFYTRAKRESAGIRVSARLLFFSFFVVFFSPLFLFGASRTYTHIRVSACFCITPREQNAAHHVRVIEDFGREWECHVDE